LLFQLPSEERPFGFPLAPLRTPEVPIVGQHRLYLRIVPRACLYVTHGSRHPDHRWDVAASSAGVTRSGFITSTCRVSPLVLLRIDP
jgi:hypothetical protein